MTFRGVKKTVPGVPMGEIQLLITKEKLLIYEEMRNIFSVFWSKNTLFYSVAMLFEYLLHRYTVLNFS